MPRPAQPTDWDEVGRAMHDAYFHAHDVHRANWDGLTDAEKRPWIVAATAAVAQFLRERLAARDRT